MYILLHFGFLSQRFKLTSLKFDYYLKKNVLLYFYIYTNFLSEHQLKCLRNCTAAVNEPTVILKYFIYNDVKQKNS